MAPMDNDDRHWIAVTDRAGHYPVKLFGPYPTKRQAERAHRCFTRQINGARYSAAVVSQGEVEGRGQARRMEALG